MSGSGRPAVFLDRDGTIIDDPGYLARADGVRLRPGAAEAIRRLNEAGRPVIVVTNQSGIGRGYYGEDDFRAVQAEMDRQLGEQGARVDAVYFCPHDPTVHDCRCRKPGTELFERAIEEHDLDGGRSWFVGDRLRDIEPAASFGGRGLLVAGADGSLDAGGRPWAEDLPSAVDRILASAEEAAPLRLAVLVSGSGSNLQALIDRLPPDEARVVHLVASRPGIGALDRAGAAGIPATVLPGSGDPAFEDVLVSTLEAAGADLVVLAGFLRRIPAGVVARWRGRMLNIHPALLPAFGGQGMYGRRVHRAVLDAGVPRSGATVHLVDEEYDRGPIVAQAEVPVYPDDDVDTLADRVLGVEHQLLPSVALAVATGSCILKSDGVTWREPFEFPHPGLVDRSDSGD